MPPPHHPGTSPPRAGGGPAPPPPHPVGRPPPPSALPPPRARPFSFRSSAGHTLHGTLVEAAVASTTPGAAPVADVAILLHGLNSHRDDTVLPALADALAAAGVGSLRYDAAGCGQSGGPFRFANYAEEAADVRLAVRALEEEEEVEEEEEEEEGEGGGQQPRLRRRRRRRRVVCVAGHSKAGTVAVLAASGREVGGPAFSAAAPPVPVCVNLAGRFHLDTGLEGRFGPDLDARLAAAGPAGVAVTWTRRRAGGATTKEAFTWRLTAADLAARRGPAAVDVGAACAALPPPTRFLTVHGTADAVVPPGEAGAYAAAAAHCAAAEVVLVEGGDHNFMDPASAAAAVEAVASFVARHRPGPEQ